MNWISRLLSKDSGASFGRVATAVVIIYVAAMTAVLIFRTDKALISLPDFPTGWLGVVGILWGVGKVVEGVVTVKTPPKEDA